MRNPYPYFVSHAQGEREVWCVYGPGDVPLRTFGRWGWTTEAISAAHREAQAMAGALNRCGPSAERLRREAQALADGLAAKGPRREAALRKAAEAAR